MRALRWSSVTVIALLASGLLLQSAASADGGPTTKQQYIKDATHYVMADSSLFVEEDPDGIAGGAGLAPANSESHVANIANSQVNDPTLDHIQTFAGTRPFEFSTQSETSIATFGNSIVVGYNTSANQPVVRIGTGLFFTHRFLSGYSVSHDGGQTWVSGFTPPAPGGRITAGDPSVGVDRSGNYYYASLGTVNAAQDFGVVVNKSTDGGNTFGPGVPAVTDNGADKEWLAVGPDPAALSHDNVYVTYTSFKSASSELWLLKSADGGVTWTKKLLFAPADTSVMSAFVQFSNPVVDQQTGRLYIPFLHFSNLDADMVRVLVSDDGGATFNLLAFNVPGAPDANAFPNVTPGGLVECGTAGGIRTVLFQGANLGGGRFGLPRYRHATRLITQPAAAIESGKLFIALNTSTSVAFGDPTAGSSIRMLYSRDGGTSWAVTTLVDSTTADPQHVHPAISVDPQGEHGQVGYYVQQADGKLRTDVTNFHVDGNRIRTQRSNRLSSEAFDLTPSFNPLPTPTNRFAATNYDRTIQACYDIGEYMSLTQVGHGTLAAWGDNRNSWTSPAGSPAAGTHRQADVFFGASRLQ